MMTYNVNKKNREENTIMIIPNAIKKEGKKNKTNNLMFMESFKGFTNKHNKLFAYI